MDEILFSDKDVIPTNQAIAKELGIGRSTVYKILGTNFTTNALQN